MPGMAMHHHAGYGGLLRYLGMWMATMVPMMLPALVPMLLRYRRSVQGVSGTRLRGLTLVVVAGYYAVWAAIGVAAGAAGAGVLAAEMRWGWAEEWRPVGVGVLLLVAGAVQFSEWKARQLTIWREGSAGALTPAPRAIAAWRHGLRLGVRCSLACGSLMLTLLAIGMMNVVAMVAVTLVISAERLAPVPLRVARVTGAVIVVVGVLTIARV